MAKFNSREFRTAHGTRAKKKNSIFIKAVIHHIRALTSRTQRKSIGSHVDIRGLSCIHLQAQSTLIHTQIQGDSLFLSL